MTESIEQLNKNETTERVWNNWNSMEQLEQYGTTETVWNNWKQYGTTENSMEQLNTVITVVIPRNLDEEMNNSARRISAFFVV